jgi:hypothetical protein
MVKGSRMLSTLGLEKKSETHSNIFSKRREEEEEKDGEDRDSDPDVGKDSCLRKSSFNSKTGSQHTAISSTTSTNNGCGRVQIEEGGRESRPASTDHVWGVVRHIKAEDKRPADCLVALVLILTVTGGSSMILLFVVGAATGGSLSDEERNLSTDIPWLPANLPLSQLPTNYHRTINENPPLLSSSSLIKMANQHSIVVFQHSVASCSQTTSLAKSFHPCPFQQQETA